MTKEYKITEIVKLKDFLDTEYFSKSALESFYLLDAVRKCFNLESESAGGEFLEGLVSPGGDLFVVPTVSLISEFKVICSMPNIVGKDISKEKMEEINNIVKESLEKHFTEPGIVSFNTGKIEPVLDKLDLSTGKYVFPVSGKIKFVELGKMYLGKILSNRDVVIPILYQAKRQFDGNGTLVRHLEDGVHRNHELESEIIKELSNHNIEEDLIAGFNIEVDDGSFEIQEILLDDLDIVLS